MALFHIFLTLFIFTHTLQYSHSQLQVKGGIIFETTRDTTLNQDYAYFIRNLDMTSLVPLKDMLKNSLETYTKVCQKATNIAKYKQSESHLDKNKLDVVTFSNDIPYVIKEYSTIFAIDNIELKNAEITCIKNNATLPEIRSDRDISAMKQLCKAAGVTEVPSNIKYDAQFLRFYYPSDYSSVTDEPFSKFLFSDAGYAKNVKFRESWKIESTNQIISKSITDKVMFYTNCNAHIEPYLKPVHSHSQQIICEIRHPFKKEYQLDDYQIALYKWTSHNCKRDTLPLQSHIEHTITEIEQVTSSKLTSDRHQILQSLLPTLTQDLQFTNPSISDSDILQSDQPLEHKDLTFLNETLFFNISREELRKDIIDTLEITTNNITLNDVTKYLDIQKTRSTRSSKRSKFSKQFEYIGGWYTATPILLIIYNFISRKDIRLPTWEDVKTMISDQPPPVITVKQFQDLTFQLSSLKLNQQELTKFYEKSNEELKTLTKMRIEDFDVITTLIAEIDLKQTIRFAINIFRQITMKIANILIAASQGTTSPFVLNAYEFQQIRTQMQLQKNNNKELTNDIDLIKTTLLTNNEANGLTLQMKIPIIDKDRQYIFFKLTPIPIFMNNTVFLPDIKTSNIAINKDFTFYTTLTEYDFWKCIDSPEYCRSNLPMRQFISGHNCVMTSYVTDEISCPLNKLDIPTVPFMFYHKLELIYSVPDQLKIFIRCQDGKTENKILTEMGRLSLQPGCVIQTTGNYNSIFYTQTELNTTSLTHWNTFKMAHFTFTNINSTIQKLTLQNSMDKMDIKAIKIPTFSEILQDAYHPSKSLSTAVHVLTWIIGITIVTFVIYCCIKTELYRFCLTDIATCKNIKKRTVHKIEKRKRQHKEHQDFKKQIKVIKKQITQDLEKQPTNFDNIDYNKIILQPLHKNYTLDQRLNDHLKQKTPYSTLCKEPSYVSINEIKHNKQRTYPDLHPLSQFNISKDTTFEQNLLQNPTDVFIQKPNAPELPPSPKKRKSKRESSHN